MCSPPSSSFVSSRPRCPPGAFAQRRRARRPIRGSPQQAGSPRPPSQRFRCPPDASRPVPSPSSRPRLCGSTCTASESPSPPSSFRPGLTSRGRYRERDPLRPHLVCTRGFHDPFSIDVVVKAFAEVRKDLQEAQTGFHSANPSSTGIHRLISGPSISKASTSLALPHAPTSASSTMTPTSSSTLPGSTTCRSPSSKPSAQARPSSPPRPSPCPIHEIRRAHRPALRGRRPKSPRRKRNPSPARPVASHAPCPQCARRVAQIHLGSCSGPVAGSLSRSYIVRRTTFFN